MADKDFSFGFIVPRGGLSPFRDYLWKNTLLSLKQQSYNNWVAVVVSSHPEEKDIIDGNIRYIYKEQSKVSRADDVYPRIAMGRDFLKSQFNPDFVGRLDDDDLINPNSLRSINEFLKGNDKIEIISAIKYPTYNIITGERMYLKSHWLPGIAFFKADKYFDIHTKEHSRNFHKLIEPTIKSMGMLFGYNYCDISDLFCHIIYRNRITSKLLPGKLGDTNFEIDHDIAKLPDFEHLLGYYKNYKEFLDENSLA